MKIGFFEIEGWEEEIARQALSGHELFFSKDKVDETHLPEQKDLEIISIFVNSKITAQVLDALPNLKLITTNSTGFEHIDLAACRAKGIRVTYVPGYGNNTVAEFAFGLILNLTRHIYQAIDGVKERNSFSLEGLRGIDLKGRTLGVIGTGRIGKEAIKIGKGFGMNILAYDPYPDAAAAQTLGYTYLSLPELLPQCDVITLHCPLTEQTRHILNMNNIGLIKKGAYLVNTARGGLVETNALVWALANGILAGAGLDVLEEEGETKDEMAFLKEGHPHEDVLRNILGNHVLMKMPNVLITPHVAFDSAEALQRILDTTLQNISGFLNNHLNSKNILV
jgi:D-lactate dehydrogenase